MLIRIKENTQQAKSFVQYIKTLSFVEIIDIDNLDKIIKEQFIEDIRKSFKEVKENRTNPLKQLLNE